MAYVMALQQGWPTDKLNFQSKKLHEKESIEINGGKK